MYSDGSEARARSSRENEQRGDGRARLPLTTTLALFCAALLCSALLCSALPCSAVDDVPGSALPCSADDLKTNDSTDPASTRPLRPRTSTVPRRQDEPVEEHLRHVGDHGRV